MNPCMACGACCASYRVSFYWAEADDGGGTVPAGLTVPVSPFLRAMAGTNQHAPRCVALEGQVGGPCACRIHALRPGPCREFGASWEQGQHEPRCDAARQKHGLAPLSPQDWVGVDGPGGGDGGAGAS